MNYIRAHQIDAAKVAAKIAIKEFPGYSLEGDESFGLFKEKACQEKQYNGFKKSRHKLEKDI